MLVILTLLSMNENKLILDAIKRGDQFNVVKEHINSKVKGLISKLDLPTKPEKYEPEYKKHEEVSPALNVDNLVERPEK